MSACGCGSSCAPGRSVAAAVETVDSAWTWCDWLGAARVRFNISRMDYRVEPGLYAVGRPTAESAVYVTSNYKLAFDHVRRALGGIDAWLLVLDTHGVNVWCAAGKGTFSTAELCRRIEATRLAQVVSHRRLILPQLGAVGIAAHEVAKQSGFTVIYGPVRAEDIPAWLAAGRRKDRAMRTVTFGFWDRLVLAPVEVTNARPYIYGSIMVAALHALLAGPGWSSAFWPTFFGQTVELLGILVLSSALVPVLLPWLPGRSFALKGAMIGLAWAAALALGASSHPGSQFWSVWSGGLAVTAAALLLSSVGAFAGLNFTGATVFTSQSGTMLETKIALPMIGIAAAAGIVLRVVAALT